MIMTLENRIRVLAGTVSLIGLALGTWWTPWAYLLTAFVAVNLIQSAFTGFCPATRFLAPRSARSASGSTEAS